MTSSPAFTAAVSVVSLQVVAEQDPQSIARGQVADGTGVVRAGHGLLGQPDFDPLGVLTSGLGVDVEGNRAGAIGEVEWLIDPGRVEHIQALVVDRFHEVHRLGAVSVAHEEVAFRQETRDRGLAEHRVGGLELVVDPLRRVGVLGEARDGPATGVQRTATAAIAVRATAERLIERVTECRLGHSAWTC